MVVRWCYRWWWVLFCAAVAELLPFKRKPAVVLDVLSLSLSATECEATVSGSDGLLIGELSKIIVEWMEAGEVRR